MHKSPSAIGARWLTGRVRLDAGGRCHRTNDAYLVEVELPKAHSANARRITVTESGNRSESGCRA